MNEIEFRNYIESIGFKFDNYYSFFKYNEFVIIFKGGFYIFFNGSKWSNHYYGDLTPIENHFKKYFRSIKLKELLR